MSLRQQLQSIYNERGELTPAVVLEEARPKNSPLHARFEWDNRVAGEKYRLIQAHELITSVKVMYSKPDGSQESVRAFHAMRRPDNPQPSYMPAEEIAEDPTTVAILLADMRREWATMKKRYERFVEFSDLVREFLNGREEDVA